MAESKGDEGRGTRARAVHALYKLFFPPSFAFVDRSAVDRVFCFGGASVFVFFLLLKYERSGLFVDVGCVWDVLLALRWIFPAWLCIF